MALMFGRFDVQSEVSNSETGLVYKATDTETNQTVALKTQSLASLGERSAAFVQALLDEMECARELASQNIAVLYGGGEIEGQFCAAMEYVQGNSVATMLSRKEGFSIWDLVDITRQMCAGLDHAASKNVVHYSLEPAKIMVQWDGLVKILDYGISRMSLIRAEAGNGLGRLLPYCSPEQVRGDSMDVRSNLFTWGAILYEMVTAHKAFDATDPGALAAQIQNDMPPNPFSLNQRVQPGVSDLIMKALAKDPVARYQTARELVADLEKCKDIGKKAAPEVKKPAASASATVSPEARSAVASKFVSARKAEPEPDAAAESSEIDVQTFSAPHPPAAPKASAAAAGVGSTTRSSATSGARMIEQPEHGAHGNHSTDPVMSAAAAEPETETHKPQIAVDPMMAGAAQAKPTKSFSDLEELPPLKEAYTPPPSPPPAPEVAEQTVVHVYPKPDQKPKVQPREVAQKAAQKAVEEIKTIPPQLMMYSILGAVAVILVVCVGLFLHVRSEDDGSTAAPRPVQPAQAPVPEPAPAQTAPEPQATQATPVIAPEPEATPQPEVTVRQIAPRGAKAAKHQPTSVVIPGSIQVDSNPEGAQIQVDGRNDPSWITPFNLTGLAPGKHAIGASKTGYTSEVRSVDVAAASKSFVSLQLSPSSAQIVLNSNPPGAEIVLDGKNTGRVTPAQFSVEKGSHSVLLRKAGYLEETTTANVVGGQNFQFGPALRSLGNADDIRNVGKFKKLFGKGNDGSADMGTIGIRTQPKGAQIALNQHLLERISPVEVMVGPGNYILDITLTGYKPVHKIITVEKGSKLAVDETMEHE
jgi:serine/threonine-protein kinase